MPSGRTRQFDPNEALDRALDVFWRRGYEGATLDELTAAMNINRPSLYAAFGNKQGLFERAVDRYAAGPAAYAARALAEPTARRVVEALFDGAVNQAGCLGAPRGCLVVHGALAAGTGAEPVRRALAARREAFVAALGERFEEAVRTGDLPAGTAAGTLARYVATVLHGLAVQAAGGATADESRGVVLLALRAWPA